MPLNHTTMNPAQQSFIVYETLSDLPKAERPNQRILREGPAVCSTAELLQVLIGGPYAETAARQLLAHCNDLRGIAIKSITELAGETRGLGQYKAAQLKACFELGRRLFAQSLELRPLIKTPADAASLLIPEMGLLEQEEVRTILLDTRNRILSTDMIYRGCLNAANMRIGEIFRDAIRHNAASIIVAHNHPSGDPTPSADDVLVTKEIVKAGKLVDIECIDHLIIAGTSYKSLKEASLGFE